MGLGGDPGNPHQNPGSRHAYPSPRHRVRAAQRCLFGDLPEVTQPGENGAQVESLTPVQALQQSRARSTDPALSK